MPARLATLFVLVVVLATLAIASSSEQTHSKRKHKKFEVGIKESSSTVDKKALRFPRQANQNEKRQYYPCISCFRIGTRDICTAPYCPDNYQCDKASKRCHKKANVRGQPVEEEVVDAAQPAQPPANTGSVPTRG